MIDVTYYTSADDVTAVLSAHGVRLRLDDDQSGSLSVAETATLTQFRGWASQTVEMYTFDHYAPAYLATSPLVQAWATWLCCYELCKRRGNAVPEVIQDEAERTEDTLKDIQGGRLRIPGIPLRRSRAPTWSNTRFNPRYTFRCIRVERRSSSPIRSALPVVEDYQSAYWVEL